MKKILSTILGVLMVFSFLLIPDLLLAQGKVGPKDVGINIDKTECIMGVGQNCHNYETMMGLSGYQPGEGYTATSVVQDVFFGATYIVGAVLTIVIIVCGLGYIFSSAGGKGLLGKSPSEYKGYLIKAALGAILVRGAYAIVRLIQYIARG